MPEPPAPIQFISNIPYTSFARFGNKINAFLFKSNSISISVSVAGTRWRLLALTKMYLLAGSTPDLIGLLNLRRVIGCAAKMARDMNRN